MLYFDLILGRLFCFPKSIKKFWDMFEHLLNMRRLQETYPQWSCVPNRFRGLDIVLSCRKKRV